MSFFHFKQSSLKARFIYAFVFVIIITITILSLTNHFRWRANYIRQFRDEGLILTQTLALGSVHPIITHNFFSLEEFAKNLTKKRNIAYVMIMDRHDRILVYKPDDLVNIPLEVNNKVKDNINPYLIQTYYNPTLETKINDISVPVIIDSKKWGTVRVGFSLAHMRKEVARNILVVLVTGLISVFIGIIVALILGRFVTGPIEKFVHSMKMVAQGDLNEEVSIDSHDEFGVLARSFNKMAKSLRRNEDELRNIYQRLIQKEKMAALGEMILNVIHKIKNPLGIIKSGAQILVDETKDPEDKRRMVISVIEEVNHLDSLIRDLLYYAKPKPMNFQKADLKDILEKKIQFWESQETEDRKIIITRRFNLNIPLLSLDVEQIGDMCLNLIINACEAMPNGGELIISIDYGSQGKMSKSNKTNESEFSCNLYDQGFVQVEFEDTGIGIPQENLEKIFNPLFTTKERGNGIGLSTVYWIVEGHRGRIEVKSTEGKGTKFTIFFPVTKME